MRKVLECTIFFYLFLGTMVGLFMGKNRFVVVLVLMQLNILPFWFDYVLFPEWMFDF